MSSYYVLEGFAETNNCQFKNFERLGLIGEDLASFNDLELNDCKEKCCSTKNCNAYVHNKEKKCVLKKEITGVSNDDNLVSGFSSLCDMKLSNNVNYDGTIIDFNTVNNITECSKSCCNNSICKGFSFSNNTNLCFLMSNITNETNTNGMISGEILHRPLATQLDLSKLVNFNSITNGGIVSKIIIAVLKSGRVPYNKDQAKEIIYQEGNKVLSENTWQTHYSKILGCLVEIIFLCLQAHTANLSQKNVITEIINHFEIKNNEDMLKIGFFINLVFIDIDNKSVRGFDNSDLSKTINIYAGVN
jgi:hypothetical protein